MPRASLIGTNRNSVPDPSPLPPPAPTPSPSPCGITDTFGRFSGVQDLTTGRSPGPSDSTLPWWITSGSWRSSAPTVEVNGTALVLTFTDADTPAHNGTQANLSLVTPAVPSLAPLRHSFTFRLTSLGRSYADSIVMGIGGFTPASATAHIVINPRNDDASLHDGEILWGSSYGGGTAIAPGFWAADVLYTVTLHDVSGAIRAEITDGITTYAADIGYSSAYVQWPTISLARMAANSGSLDLDNPAFPDWAIAFDSVDAPEFTVCTMQGLFDNFADRLAVGGWGPASSGLGTWEVLYDSNSAFNLANSIGGWPTKGWQFGRWDSTGVGTHQGGIAVTGTGTSPWEGAGGFVFTSDFYADTIGSDVFWWLGNDGAPQLTAEMWMDPTGGYIDLATDNFGNDDFVAKLDWQFGEWYTVEVIYVPGGNAEIRVWLRETESRPVASMVTVIATTPAVGSLAVYPSSASTGSRIGVANIAFGNP